MLKICFLLTIATLSLVSQETNAVCCGSYEIFFKTIKTVNCNDIERTVSLNGNKNNYCQAHKVCGNGRPIGEGNYCGKGRCNLFGCNCDGGCIEGNPIRSFQALYGLSVYQVSYNGPPQKRKGIDFGMIIG